MGFQASRSRLACKILKKYGPEHIGSHQRNSRQDYLEGRGNVRHSAKDFTERPMSHRNRIRDTSTTTIPLEKETRDRLRLLGRKGENYDEILRRLMSFAEHEEFMERQYDRLKDKKAFVSLSEL
jgi:hypothetical protein